MAKGRGAKGSGVAAADPAAKGDAAGGTPPAQAARSWTPWSVLRSLALWFRAKPRPSARPRAAAPVPPALPAQPAAWQPSLPPNAIPDIGPGPTQGHGPGREPDQPQYAWPEPPPAARRGAPPDTVPTWEPEVHGTCTLPLPPEPILEPAPEPAWGAVALYAPPRRGGGHADGLAVEVRRQPRPAAVAVAVPDATGRDLLVLLQQARARAKVVVVRFDNLPTLCVVPGIDMVYSLAPMQALFDAPSADLAPAFVTVARNSHHGRTEAQAYRSRATKGLYVTMLDTPLKDLLWVATLRCGGAPEAQRYMAAAFVLHGWPDLSTLPHHPHHLKWCGLLARRAMTATALATATGHATSSAAVFLAALNELGILRQKAPELEAGPTRLALDAPLSRRAAGGVLGRLGLGRG